MSDVIEDRKTVWVAWTNTDLTEGRGTSYPLCVAESQATARRRGAKGAVQGTDCRVTQETAYRINHQWYVPGRIERPSDEDAAKQKVIDAREDALRKARDAGLTDDDLSAIMSRV